MLERIGKYVVTIHEFGEEQGTPYIVMEYMSGTDLATGCRILKGVADG